MKNKTYIIGLVLLVIIIGLVFGYNSGKSNTEEAPSQTASVKIGALLSLTGKFASFGEDTKHGIELAVQELKVRGVDLSIIYEDSVGDPKTALTGASKLVTQDKVDVIIASPGSSANLAIAPELEKNKKIFIAISSTPKLNTAGPYTFKGLPDIDPEVQMMIPKIVSNGSKKLGILFDSGSETHVGASALAATLFETYPGNKAYPEGFDAKMNDYRSQVSKLKDQGVDAVYILSNDKGAGIAVRQVRELGLKQTIYGWSGIAGGDFFKGAEKFADGVVITDQPFTCLGDAPMKKYCDEYKSSTAGKIPLVYGAHAYDLMQIIGAVVEDNPTARGEALKTLIMTALTSKTYSGVSGDLAFDENGNITKHVFEFRTAKGGEFVKTN